MNNFFTANKSLVEAEIRERFTIILNHTIEGKVYSLLYVSQYQEEWVLDKEELKEGQPLAYVYCPFDDFCSEFGGIGIDKGYGGIIRIW